MVYLTAEEFEKKHPELKHICWVCKTYMSTPYEVKIVFGELVVTVPVCFEHRKMLLKEQIDVIEKK